MIDKEAVTGALDAISDAINAQLNALDGANLAISLVRACEKLLTDESFDDLIAHLDDDDEEVLH